MSWRIGLHLEPAIAEICAVPDDASPLKNEKLVGNRWLHHKTALQEGVRSFFEKNPEVQADSISVTHNYFSNILERRSGDAPALVITSGFEHWPFLRAPIINRSWTLKPKRAQPLLEGDLVFGVAERTAADGTVLQTPSEEDLAFLVSKIQFTGTKTVCVCLLHSSQNPANEDFIGAYFTKAGFKVYLSSQEKVQTSNEVARWWRTFARSYSESAHEELLAPLKGLGEKWKLHAISPHHQMGFESFNPLLHLIQEKTLYLGWDRWGIIDPKSKQKIFSCDIGPIAVDSPQFESLGVHPFSEIGPDFWRSPSYLNQTVLSDLGPMAFGRSLRPTCADFIHGALNFNGHLPQEALGTSTKFDEALSSLAKTLHYQKPDVISFLKERLSDLLLSVQSIHGENLPVIGSFSELPRVLGLSGFQYYWNGPWARSLSAALGATK